MSLKDLFKMKNKKAIITIVIMAAALAAITIYAVWQKKANTEMTQLFALEKEEMENEYSNFATQYDELQIQIDNDSIRERLEEEKIKTQRLLEELRRVKSTNAYEIHRLKKELSTIRKVLRSYIVQIDSLNKKNEELTTENKKVKRQYSEATRTISNLSREKDNLNQKVTRASQLDATAVSVRTLNKRGRNTRKVKKVKTIQVDFTIVKNITAEAGNKTIYIRMLKPDNTPMFKSPGDMFGYENTQINYSMKRMIEYTGEEQQVSMYWQVEEYLPAGNYRIFIFADGNMIGQGGFSMK